MASMVIVHVGINTPGIDTLKIYNLFKKQL